MSYVAGGCTSVHLALLTSVPRAFHILVKSVTVCIILLRLL